MHKLRALDGSAGYHAPNATCLFVRALRRATTVVAVAAAVVVVLPLDQMHALPNRADNVPTDVATDPL